MAEYGTEAPRTASSPSPEQEPALTDEMLVILPVRNMVLFPGVVHPITVGRPASIAAVQRALRENGKLGLLLQREAAVTDPGPGDLHDVGTVVSILRYGRDTDESHFLIGHGEARFRVAEFMTGYPYLVARIEKPDELLTDDDEIQARVLVLKQQAARAIELLPQVPAELAAAVQSIESPGALSDLIAGFLEIPPAEKQNLLETFDVRQRLETVVDFMAKRLEIIELSHQIEQQTRASIDKRQRETVLREQMRTIQQHLGESDGDATEFEAIDKSIVAAGMPEETERHARKELARLKRMPTEAAEYSMLRNYLDWLVDLPWSRLDTESIDVANARRVLDEDHYGLDRIKVRIIEYLAVRKLNPDGRSPILCFVGPPGVGKTSLGQSIARAVGLEFARISLGGVHDEAEIRGHRRTYIGALPGKIIQAIRKAGSRNPVFMLDEIDKLGLGVHGDPASALLEVLDPEQNSTFQDNYLGVPFDLSNVMFIATANQLDTIPPALLDRMEVIELNGYTVDEKLQIAKRYLVDRQCRSNGLSRDQVEISDAGLLLLITGYTHEAGCRNLEKQVGAILRNVAVSFARGATEKVHVDADDVRRILGAPRFEDEAALRTSLPGVATGLAWTPMGGDILFIESTRVPGDGKLILTGQLGDVMKESAQAAMTLIKGRFSRAQSGPDSLRASDVHIHVPAGAIPKDGPSAGVTIFVSLASLFAERTVRHDVAMTGEISLRGQVLPVGGIKEKVIAAHRAGIRTVLLPDRNRKDFDEIPESVRLELRFVWLKTVDDALAAALTPGHEVMAAGAGPA
jgi:ATP-dependent Lon protease